jgi:ribosomal protein L13E
MNSLTPCVAKRKFAFNKKSCGDVPVQITECQGCSNLPANKREGNGFSFSELRSAEILTIQLKSKNNRKGYDIRLDKRRNTCWIENINSLLNLKSKKT